jgi:hypothetical protein
MATYSGSHELYGRFALSASPRDTRNSWLEARSFANKFEQRDSEWWLGRVARFEGSEIELYEAERSSYSIVQDREAFIDFIARHAVRGRAFLQHIENGFHVTSWEVIDSKVSKNRRSGHRRMAALPTGTRAEAHFREVDSRQERHWEARTPADRFEEALVRYGRSRRAFFLHGGDEVLRRRAAEAIRQAMGATSWCELTSDGSNLGRGVPQGVAFVPEAGTLPSTVQLSLLERLREGTVKLILATASEPNELVARGLLSTELHYFVSPGLLDLRDVHP